MLTNLQGLELEGQVRPFKYDDELEQRQLLCAILAEKLKVWQSTLASVTVLICSELPHHNHHPGCSW